MNKIIILTLMMLVAIELSAQDDSGVIIYGKDWAYIISPPSGWVMNDHILADRGIYAFFYEKGKKPSSIDPVIYINTKKLDNDSDEELNIFIDSDIELAKEKTKTRVEEKTLELKVNGDEKINRVVEYSFMSNSQFETVIYIKYKQYVHMLILTTRSPFLRDDLLNKLIEVYNSINFMDNTN